VPEDKNEHTDSEERPRKQRHQALEGESMYAALRPPMQIMSPLLNRTSIQVDSWVLDPKRMHPLMALQFQVSFDGAFTLESFALPWR
jgi:hypothetical protein